MFITLNKAEKVKFAIAGIAYVFVSGPLLNSLFYLSLYFFNVPVSLKATSVSLDCTKTGRYFATPDDTIAKWILNGWYYILIFLVCLGFIGLFVAKKKDRNGISIFLWLSILFISIPFYWGGEFFRTLVCDAFKGRSDILIGWVMTLIYSVIMAPYLYFKIFIKCERKYLWLITLPSIILTYLLWFFVIAPATLNR